ncbi:vomeronasal type-2 receptor 26-like [Pelodytes ibericus]
MWDLVFLCVVQIASCTIDLGCRLTSMKLTSIEAQGDIQIGSVVPIHVDKTYPTNNFTAPPAPAICEKFRLENYQRAQAMIFAVEEINRDPDILPNITLGFQIYDSCTVLQRAIIGTLQLLTGIGKPQANYRCQQEAPLAAVIGHSISTYSMVMAHILGLYRYPQIPVSVCSQSCLPGFRKASITREPACCYQCVPCPYGEFSNQTDSLDCMKCPWDMWTNSQQNLCVPKPREFLSYEDPLGSTLAATSVSSSLVPVAIFVLFLRYKTTPIVRANNYTLSCLLLISLSLCFLCSLAFIGYPHPVKCCLRQVTFGIVFALGVSCILAKTILVVLAFKATKPGSSLKKWTSSSVSFVIALICVTFQIILCISWILLSPPFIELNVQIAGIIVVECNEGSNTAFWSMLGYLGLLATISFIVAFLARGLPDSFNEAKFITFSMLAFLSVWLSYIPASLSTQGKYTVAMEIFAILSSSWALVLCMFVPKCFIILFRPNMNSKNHIMRKE